MLAFSIFHEMVKGKKRLCVTVYSTILKANKVGIRTEDIFNEAGSLTDSHRVDYDEFMGSLSSNRGSKKFASALYYWFHVKCPDKGYADLIDEALFEDSLRHYFLDESEAHSGETSEADEYVPEWFNTASLEATSKSYEDCQPLRDMANHITGVYREQRQLGSMDSCSENFSDKTGWFGHLSLPKEDRDRHLWSAVNTICHVASGARLLPARDLDHLILYLLNFASEVPDSYAPLVCRVLRDIRDDQLMKTRAPEYSNFRFNRSYRISPHTRRLRMVQKERAPLRYKSLTDALYWQHEGSLETLSRAKDHIGEYGANFDVETAMALSSVIHALAIDPLNEKGQQHPLIEDWMHQLEDIAQRQPRALIHLLFAKLQIASLKDNPEILQETLHGLREKLQKANMTTVPLYQALELNLTVLEKQSAGNEDTLCTFFALPVPEQVLFMVRCNIGILPTFRDKFVDFHIQNKTSLMPLVRARFGSNLR